MKLTYFILSILCTISVVAAIDMRHPVFWERMFSLNITNTSKSNKGVLMEETGIIVKSQDFQTIQSDPNPQYPPHRIVFNFGESCRSSNTTIDTLRQLNHNSIEAASIVYAQKVALVKRGSCNWSEKMAVVNELTKQHELNMTAIFFYDNNTYQDISIERTLATGTGSVDPPTYPTELPIARNITSMQDNDLLTIPSASSMTIYFIPFEYGDDFVQKISRSFNPNNPDFRNFILVTPYLNGVSWPSVTDNFFASGRGYLSYIIALGAVFLIGIVFLRWWKIRRLRAEYPDGIPNNFNGFTMANGFSTQPRSSRTDPLPVDIVNSLPIDKYQEDLVKNENCAICLEDFVAGKNDIRILPCGHGFCVLCIDPWLTQKSTSCPICKWDCLPADLRQERNEQLERERNARQNSAFIIQMPFSNNNNRSSNVPTTDIPLTTYYTPTDQTTIDMNTHPVEQQQTQMPSPSFDRTEPNNPETSVGRSSTPNQPDNNQGESSQQNNNSTVSEKNIKSSSSPPPSTD